MWMLEERGEIFFFYRPKVAKEEAHGPDDVQRRYMVLRPESGERAVKVKQDPLSGKEGQSKSSNNGDDDKQAKDSSSTEGGSLRSNLCSGSLLWEGKVFRIPARNVGRIRALWRWSPQGLKMSRLLSREINILQAWR